MEYLLTIIHYGFVIHVLKYSCIEELKLRMEMGTMSEKKQLDQEQITSEGNRPSLVIYMYWSNIFSNIMITRNPSLLTPMVLDRQYYSEIQMIDAGSFLLFNLYYTILQLDAMWFPIRNP